MSIEKHDPPHPQSGAVECQATHQNDCWCFAVECVNAGYCIGAVELTWERSARKVAEDQLSSIEQVILRIEDPKIPKGDRTTDDWLAQILQVFVMERDIALKEIDILIARINELLAEQALP